MHMKRARDAFEAAGLEVVPAPTAWLGGGDKETAGDQALVELPSQNTAYAGWFALHELLGQLAAEHHPDKAAHAGRQAAHGQVGPAPAVEGSSPGYRGKLPLAVLFEGTFPFQEITRDKSRASSNTDLRRPITAPPPKKSGWMPP